MRIVFILVLLLTSVNAYAQNKPAISAAEGVSLSGLEDPATTKVYIVQLRSPSAGEFHAALSKSNAMSSSSATKALPRLQKDSAAIRSYTARLDGEQKAVMQKAGPGTEPIYSYKYGLNGFAARMSVAQAQKIKEFDEVLNVWEDEVRPLATRDSRSFLGLFDSIDGLRSQHELDGAKKHRHGCDCQ